jgi:hypothetical protein
MHHVAVQLRRSWLQCALSPAPPAQLVELLPTPLGAARDAIMTKEAYLPTGERDDVKRFLKV